MTDESRRPILAGMDPATELAERQLARMRGMNALYHRRFFSDIRFHLVLTLALLAAGVVVHPAFYLAVAPVVLAGACQTAFDASYLLFSRHYAAHLERFLNGRVGVEVLVAHRMEDAYLFPLDQRKVVTLAFGPGFTWFGFMTVFYTVLGIAFYVLGVGLSLGVLNRMESPLVGAAYLAFLVVLTGAALGVGWWWFAAGEGERRLAKALAGSEEAAEPDVGAG
jgi:hypothetical protein